MWCVLVVVLACVGVGVGGIKKTRSMVWPLCLCSASPSMQRKATKTVFCRQIILVFCGYVVLVTLRASLPPVLEPCHDGEITFDSLILLHNKLSSCNSVTLGSQFDEFAEANMSCTHIVPNLISKTMLDTITLRIQSEFNLPTS